MDELLHQWDVGTIRLEGEQVVIDEQARSWYRGVLGERRVAEVLASLDDRWTVLHSVPVGKGTTDIDHVVIGPSGVFTINTKYSPGKEVWVAGRGMYVGGFKQPYVLNSLAEAKRASELLSLASGLTVPVTSVIVFIDPAKVTHKAAAGGGEYEPEVRVLRDTEILATIRTRPVFSVEQADRIAKVAVEPTTWHAKPAPSTNGRHISAEFLALEQALGTYLVGPLTRSPDKAASVRRPVDVSRTRHNTRPAPRWGRAPRPSAHSPRRRKRSTLEKLFYELAFPLAGLIGLWLWSQSATGK